MWRHLSQLRHISLKWKLLIPFLFLPAALTLIFVVYVIQSQSSLINHQEEALLRRNYAEFQVRIRSKLETVQALAALTASNPAVREALRNRDREALLRLYQPVYESLKILADIKQFHFHVHPARSFLRLHRPQMFEDDLSGYRPTIVQAHETGEIVGGLEFGLTGFGPRGVAPITANGRIIGSVELGGDLGAPFLGKLKKDLKCDLTIYTRDKAMPWEFRPLAPTAPSRIFLSVPAYREAVEHGKTSFLTTTNGNERLAVLIGPIHDFQGQAVAVLEITRDRSTTLTSIRKHTILILAIGLVLLSLSLVFVWWVSTLFLKPIDALMDQADKITSGHMVPQMQITVRDEFGTLAAALNRMLAGLEDSRHLLKLQARDLEIRVRERTAELVQSEEKYRTLLENIPLVVYRLEHGLVRSFVSPHIEVLTGSPPEKLVGNRRIWSASIRPEDREQVLAAYTDCLTTGRPFEIEYRLMDSQGLDVDVLDIAEPHRNENNRVLYVQGFILDMREHKRLEDQTARAEELKTLTEISARLAHEFRNPLSTVGLCAHRLAGKLMESDPASRYAEILIEEVRRLEGILKMILSYIRPLELHPAEVDTRSFFEEVIRQAESHLKDHEIEPVIDLSDDLPRMELDADLLGRALQNLIRNAAYQLAPRSNLHIFIGQAAKILTVRLIYPAGYLPDDKLRHFFYPFTTEEADPSLVDLPLVPAIVHRHGGTIEVKREDEDMVAVVIELPVKSEGAASTT